VIPVALFLNWLLNVHWMVGEDCLDFMGQKMQSSASGFPFPSMMRKSCNDTCIGADERAISYFMIVLNGMIKVLLASSVCFLLRKKINLKLWQKFLWVLLAYLLFGSFLRHEFENLSQCGEFSHTGITGLSYNFKINLFWLFNRTMETLFLFWYLILPACIVLSVLVWKTYKHENDRSCKWWILFYFIWILFFTVVLISELWLQRFDDQMITSSGDHTYRQEWYSILIGYTIIIAAYIFSMKQIRKNFRKGILISVPLFILSFFIFLKNEHCIVLGTSGMRFVEFYTPFYENEYIGDFMEGVDDPLQDLGEGRWRSKNITRIHTEENKIIFTRPLVKDYEIRKQFLWWSFDFPEEIHD
jgi:hypothetical protein